MALRSVLLLWLAHIDLVLVRAQGQEPTPSPAASPPPIERDNGVDSASIVGFVVVLVFLLVALCVVMLLCLKYGTCKRVIRRQTRSVSISSTAAVRRNRSLMLPSPVATRHSKRSHTRKVSEVARHKSTDPVSPHSLYGTEQVPTMTPLTLVDPQSHHTLPSTPHTPITPSSIYTRPISVPSFGTPARVAPVNVEQTPPPYTGMGYPYRPFKSNPPPQLATNPLSYHDSQAAGSVSSTGPSQSPFTLASPSHLHPDLQGMSSPGEMLESGPCSPTMPLPDNRSTSFNPPTMPLPDSPSTSFNTVV